MTKSLLYGIRTLKFNSCISSEKTHFLSITNRRNYIRQSFIWDSNQDTHANIRIYIKYILRINLSFAIL